METSIVHATEEFLKSEIAKKDEDIARLTNIVNEYSKSTINLGNSLRTMSVQLQDWTMSQLENGEINEEQATELSEIGNFDLTKEVEAEVTVKYWITLQVPAGESAEDIINEIDFESVSYDTEAITNISYEVADIDL